MLEADLSGTVGSTGINVRLEALRGQATALVGPSGCGKTTALKMIAGLHPLDGGRVSFDGTTWQEGSRRPLIETEERRLAFVFQDQALFPRMTAASNVRFALRDLPRATRRSTALDMLDAVGLPAHADSRPDELSGGERQRLALARALASRPSLLLLDEPFAALDRQGAAEMRSLVGEVIKSQDIACVIVTHDEADSDSLATTTVSMQGDSRRILT